MLALFCQESAIVLPALGGALSWAFDRGAVGPLGGTAGHVDPGLVESLRRAFARTAIHWLIVGLYVVYRFFVIPTVPRQANYESVWGTNVLRNVVQYTEWIAGGRVGTGVVLATLCVGAGFAAWAWSRRGERGPLWVWLVVLAFLVAEILPFGPVRAIAPRFAIAAEVPLVLLFGLGLAVPWRLWPAFRPVLGVCGLVLVLAAGPYSTLAEAFRLPRGNAARHIAERLVTDLDPAPASGTRVVVMGAPDSGSLWAVRRETWTGSPMLSALWPGQGLMMSFVEADDPVAVPDLAPNASYYVLDAEKGLRPAAASERAVFFGRGLESARVGAAPAAAARLAMEQGEAAVPALVGAAKAAGPDGHAIAEALLLIGSVAAEREVLPWLPDATDRRRAAWRVRAAWLGEEPPGGGQPARRAQK